jgi:hypothetical protein
MTANPTKYICLVFCLLFVQRAVAQDDRAELAALYSELDSLFENESIPDLFKLADSILALDSAKISSLNIRAGYVSQVVTSGRTFGFNQFGVVPGLTYYHHSGLYGGATGYWSSDFEPQYYLTDMTLGFAKTVFKNFNVNVTQDFLFYNDTLPSHSFSKTSGVAINYQRTFGDAAIDYTLMYGNETAHRITGSVNGKLRIRTSGFLKSVTVLPTFSIQYGTANVLYVRQPRTAVSELYEIVKANDYPTLTLRQYIRLTYLLETDREYAAQYFLRYNGYTQTQAIDVIDQYYEGQYRVDNTFGLMNYSLSLPVMMSHGRWTVTLNYTYNIPVALPGEPYEYESNGYFSGSVSYLLNWVKK